MRAPTRGVMQKSYCPLKARGGGGGRDREGGTNWSQLDLDVCVEKSEEHFVVK